MQSLLPRIQMGERQEQAALIKNRAELERLRAQKTTAVNRWVGANAEQGRQQTAATYDAKIIDTEGQVRRGEERLVIWRQSFVPHRREDITDLFGLTGYQELYREALKQGLVMFETPLAPPGSPGPELDTQVRASF